MVNHSAYVFCRNSKFLPLSVIKSLELNLLHEGDTEQELTEYLK